MEGRASAPSRAKPLKRPLPDSESGKENHSDTATNVGSRRSGDDVFADGDGADDADLFQSNGMMEDDASSDDDSDSDLDVTSIKAQRDEIEMFLEQWPDVALNYKVLKKIGEGTFSSVYKAIDLNFNRYENGHWLHKAGISAEKPDVVHVALKRIYVTSSAQRIHNELELLKELRYSDGIVPIITASRYNDQVVAVLPYFDNQEFREYYMKLEMDEIRAYMRELFVAVKSVHAKNILHRDIKPSNFLYNFRLRRGMLTDFGLAQKVDRLPDDTYRDKTTGKTKPLLSQLRRARDRDHGSAKTAPSPFKVPKTLKQDTRPSRRANRAGTRGFRAPEVLFKVQHQTTAIDIWSCGVILLCFFTQQFPFFQSNDDMDAIVEIAQLFGNRNMSDCAALFNVSWETDIPSIPDDVHPNDVFRRLCTKILERNHPDLLARIPPEGYDLLTKTFALDPRERITAAQALVHPFLVELDE
ncbi:kinase-like domain-containing protein [Hyaloraphidium curvatum]|nr:kinase-like domain-containing protein [Hyaloraphidium curvatum]